MEIKFEISESCLLDFIVEKVDVDDLRIGHFLNSLISSLYHNKSIPCAWLKSQIQEIYLDYIGLFITDKPLHKLPEIVCLCGSTRFYEEFQKANLEETLKGNIVLSIGCDTKSDQGLNITIEQKKMLDELHLRKIDLADEVYILNVGGYIGESTARELAYAKSKGKLIRYLEY